MARDPSGVLPLEKERAELSVYGVNGCGNFVSSHPAVVGPSEYAKLTVEMFEERTGTVAVRLCGTIQPGGCAPGEMKK